jgi:hypothetical protein
MIAPDTSPRHGRICAPGAGEAPLHPAPIAEKLNPRTLRFLTELSIEFGAKYADQVQAEYESQGQGGGMTACRPPRPRQEGGSGASFPRPIKLPDHVPFGHGPGTLGSRPISVSHKPSSKLNRFEHTEILRRKISVFNFFRFLSYMSVGVLLGMLAICALVIFEHEDFSTAIVIAATSGFFTQGLGLIFATWRIMFRNWTKVMRL